MRSFVLVLGVFLLLIGLSACKPSPQFKQNLNALYVTSFNPLHQKNVPKLKNTKITNKNDIQKLYSILLNSRKAPSGSVSCAADSGVYYKLKFESKNKHMTITVHPTGCGSIKIPHMKTRILWGKSGITFWRIMAKDLYVKNVNHFRGFSQN